MISDAETVTVTATNRLARHLELEHARRMREEGSEAWETPAIMPWQVWLVALFERVAVSDPNPPLLLSPGQARALWNDIIQASDAGRGLMRPARAVARVQQARDRLHEYRLAPGQVDPGESADVNAFVDWAGAFDRCCDERGWLDPGALAGWLARRVAASAESLPRRLVLAGFDQLAPAEKALTAALEAAGVVVETAPFPGREASVTRFACADASAEVEAAAVQARRWLEADPSARVGIVVPALESRRAALARALEAALTPGSRLAPSAPADPPFNLSLGTPLRNVGLVADALAALKLMTGSVSWETGGRLLRSPYFAGASEERGPRATMDAILRAGGERRWTLARLERAAEACQAPRWRTALQRARKQSESGSGRVSPGDWSRRVNEWLSALGWCRGGTLASRDYQAQQAWFDLLRDFSRLGAVTGTMDAAEARQALADMAAETPFQPRGGAAPVQVLGLLEAAGLAFDHLWVMGLSDDAWPRPPAPNPFLPLSLQVEHGMPHAGARRQLAFAEGVTARLLASAPEVILSWPRREGDADLAPSSLLPADASEHEADAPPGGLAAWRRGDMTIVADDRTPAPVAPGEVVGGSALLTDQAACPFRAFAARRLGADPLDQPAVALDARARGSLVHEALRVFWDEVGSRERLATLGAERRAARIGDAVREARRRLERRLPPQEDAFWALEDRRLRRLLDAWLAVELARDPFTVAAREESASLTLAGLTLSLQADRRDRLEDGRELIIDYKTGTTGHSPKAWLSERPDQPQLPSYALAMEDQERLGGLAFAHVRPRQPNYAGVVESDGEVVRFPRGSRWPERPEGCRDMGQLARYWRERLEALATGFREGVSHTDPNHPRVCDHCHRQVLCRVREIRMFWGEAGEDSDD